MIFIVVRYELYVYKRYKSISKKFSTKVQNFFLWGEVLQWNVLYIYIYVSEYMFF